MEKQYDGQEDAKYVAVAVASESEYEIQQHSKHKHNSNPRQMESRGKFGRGRRIADKGLRNVRRGHHNDDTRQSHKETYPFPFVKDVETMFASDLKDQRDGKRHNQLGDKVGVAEGFRQMQARPAWIQEIYHIIVEIDNGKDGKGYADVALPYNR